MQQPVLSLRRFNLRICAPIIVVAAVLIFSGALNSGLLLGSVHSQSNTNDSLTMQPLSHFVYVGTSIDSSNDTCGTVSSGEYHCYSPAMIQKAYDFTGAYNILGGYKNAGAGQTIVIIDGFGSPTIKHDLRSSTRLSTFLLPI